VCPDESDIPGRERAAPPGIGSLPPPFSNSRTLQETQNHAGICGDSSVILGMSVQMPSANEEVGAAVILNLKREGLS
jgi:hypothetical protein